MDFSFPVDDEGRAYPDEDYESARGKMLERNDAFLEEFEQWLEGKGLKEKTIAGHLSNVSFYLDEYLQYEQATPMEYGAAWGYLNGYFGDFFIRKCMWSTPSATRQTLASLKKFYQCMAERGHIEEELYQSYLEDVKEMKEEWVSLCDEYNTGETNPFAWF